jgi:TrpR-related protein YerC/YecD
MEENSNVHNTVLQDLLQAFLQLKTVDEIDRFLKDLCTPQELKALAERWRVCQLLNEGTLSYREINEKTGASLATITRVARFLKEEPHRGYQLVLKKIRKKST